MCFSRSRYRLLAFGVCVIGFDLRGIAVKGRRGFKVHGLNPETLHAGFMASVKLLEVWFFGTEAEG